MISCTCVKCSFSPHKIDLKSHQVTSCHSIALIPSSTLVPLAQTMAPHAEDRYVPATIPNTSETSVNGHVGKDLPANGKETFDHIQSKKPLEPKGVLEEFKYFDVTPVIGREFKDVDVVAWLQSPNSDELIRDLAITSRFAPLLPDIPHYRANTSF